LTPRQLIIGVVAMGLVALAMGAYVSRFRNRARQEAAVTVDAHAPAPPAAGPTEQVTLYVAYDDPGLLLPQSSIIPLPAGRQQRAEELLRALLDLYLQKTSSHPLGPGADLRAVYVVDPGLVVIDFNAAFADGHRSGILVEELTIISLVETLSANIPGVTRVKILIDGRERETLAGHADLSRFYDVSGVDDLLAQLRSAR
jgi:spore germination protein GerM